MTVVELIEALQKIEDKTKTVHYVYDGPDTYDEPEVTEVVETGSESITLR
jgi:hypothetical protein